MQNTTTTEDYSQEDINMAKEFGVPVEELWDILDEINAMVLDYEDYLEWPAFTYEEGKYYDEGFEESYEG